MLLLFKLTKTNMYINIFLETIYSSTFLSFVPAKQL